MGTNWAAAFTRFRTCDVMFTLTRKTFLDRLLDPDDLDDMTELWLSWHDEAQLRRTRALHGYHAVELRLYGFPRQRGSLLKDELQRALAKRGWHYALEASDPDYLSVSTEFEDLSRP